MAKATKEKVKSKRPTKYHDKEPINATFMQIMQAVVKDAKSKRVSKDK